MRKPVIRKTLSEELFFVRGMSLMLVVLVHVIGVEPFQGVRKLFSPERAELRFASEFIHSFNMAVMIIGSGVAVSLFGAPDRSFREFAHKKLRKLVVPMLVWAPVFLFAHELTQARPRTPGGWLALLGRFPAAWFPPYAIFWFIHALVGCTCLAWVYQRIVPARYNWNGLSYLALSWVSYAAVESLESPMSDIGMRYLRFILFWNCLFGLGMSLSLWLALARTRLSQLPLALQGLVPSGFLGLLVSFHVSGLAEGHLDPRLLTGPLGFCLQFTLAFFLLGVARSLGATWKGLARWIVYLGSISMPLYLFHIYFVSGVRLALGKVLPGAPLALHLALGVFGGLMGPLGLYLLLERNRAFRWSIGLRGVPLDTPELGANESPGTRPPRVEASTMKGADV